MDNTKIFNTYFAGEAYQNGRNCFSSITLLENNPYEFGSEDFHRWNYGTMMGAMMALVDDKVYLYERLNEAKSESVKSGLV